MLAMANLVVAVCASVALADAPVASAFNIPTQPLRGALAEFARQSGVQVMVSEADVAGRRSPGVRGRMTPETALERLLSGSGLAARRVNDRAMVVARASPPPVRSAPPPSPPAALMPTARIDEVVVTGYRDQQTDAVEAKRRAIQLIEARTSDSIGQQPDYNVADSLRRLPGVQTVFDEDEGRYVSIRGLNPNYTIGSLDGAGMATAERNNRQLNMEALPSSAATALEVIKTRTPDIDGNAIGGAINLRIRSPLREPGLTAVGSFVGGLSDSTNGPGRGYGRPFDDGENFRFDGFVSTTFGTEDQVGLLLSANYSRRSRDQERFSAGGHAVTSSDFTPAPRGAFINSRVYPNTINRYGALAKIEARLTDDVKLGFLASRFQQDDNELRLGHNLVNGSPGLVQFNSFQIEKPITTLQTSLDWRPDGGGHLSLRASRSRARFYEPSPELTFSSSATARFDIALRNGVTVTSGADASLFDPAQYAFSRYSPYVDDSRESVDEFQADYAVNRGAGASGWGLQIGAKHRDMTREFDRSQTVYVRYAPGRLGLTDYLTPDRYKPLYADFELPVIDYDAFLRFFQTHADSFVVDEAASAASVASTDYRVSERVTATYALAEHRGERHALILGGRWEMTSTGVISVRYDAGSTTVTPVSYAASFTDFLPSASLLYDFSPDLRLRLSFSEGLGRPSPGDLGATERIADNGGLVGGNPALRPRRGRSYDLSIERYFDNRRSLVAVNLFHKTVRGEIYRYASQEVIDGTPITVQRPRNSGNASIDGAEFSISRRSLPHLPDMGLAANLTWMRGHALAIGADGAPRRLDYLPQQSDWLFNLMLFYEKGPVGAYLSHAYVGDARTVVGATPDLDEVLLASNQVDLQFRYRLRPNLRLMGEIRNLTGQDKRTMTGPDAVILRDLNMYGRQLWFGMSIKR